MLSEAYRPILI